MPERERILIDAERSARVLPRRVLQEICAHARETQPEECCGLITGASDQAFLAVYRCRNEMTRQHQSDPENFPRDGRHAYYMNEIDYLNAQKDAEARGERVTAVYHSHVDTGVYFSEMDQEFAAQELFPFPDAAHIVVALWEGQVSGVGIFEREASAGGFRGRAVHATSP